MSGYYPVIYGFEDMRVDREPAGWYIDTTTYMDMLKL